MKNITMLLALTMLLFGVSGQAMAYFADGDLIRVIYDLNGTMENVTDLGSIASVTSAITANVPLNTNNFSLASLDSTATYANSYVAYYDVVGTAGQAWTSGPLTGQTANLSNYSGFEGGAHSVNGTYALAGTASVTASQTLPNSYWNIMDGSNGVNPGSSKGQMNGFLPNGDGEASLANLATAGFVDQTLYYYTDTARGYASGLGLGTIVTYIANGQIETEIVVNGTATPVPAAVYLFGSGLVGLVGIRRKMAA